jgi:hypothetical protein
VYTYYDEGVGFAPPTDYPKIIAMWESGPPTLVVDRWGVVYVAWSTGSTSSCPVYIARIEGDSVVKTKMDAEYRSDCWEVPIPTTGYHLSGKHSWSIKPSLVSQNVLYYAYHHRESSACTYCKDVYISTGTFHPATELWSWSTPEAVVHSNDERDQFSPTVEVTSDGNFWEWVHVAWYDRREACAISPPTLIDNYCIRAKKSSASMGFGFTEEYNLQKGVLTDPMKLPGHCMHPSDTRFIGDYNEGRGFETHDFSLGSSLRSHFTWAYAPIGSPDNTAKLDEAFISLPYYNY